MIVLCEDDCYREFIPATLPTGRVYVGDPAYCKHCKTTFRVKPTNEQKELWIKHSCNGYRSKKIRNSE